MDSNSEYASIALTPRMQLILQGSNSEYAGSARCAQRSRGCSDHRGHLCRCLFHRSNRHDSSSKFSNRRFPLLGHRCTGVRNLWGWSNPLLCKPRYRAHDSARHHHVYPVSCSSKFRPGWNNFRLEPHDNFRRGWFRAKHSRDRSDVEFIARTRMESRLRHSSA